MIQVTYQAKKYTKQNNLLSQGPITIDYEGIEEFSIDYAKRSQSLDIKSVSGITDKERLELSDKINERVKAQEALWRSRRNAEVGKAFGNLGDQLSSFGTKCLIMFLLMVGVPIGLASVVFSASETSTEVEYVEKR